jgi:FMN phosphatase YigB (HAD superfamily)
MKNYKYCLFDAVGTLIHKPKFYLKFQEVIRKHGFEIGNEDLLFKHKFLIETIEFPDRTNEDFYKNFNFNLLQVLGIPPTNILLKEIFENCKNLKWERTTSSKILKEIGLPLVVVSNFNSSLSSILIDLYGNIFSDIIISENIKIRKPNVEFYKYSLGTLGVKSQECLYIGDSFKLDFIPSSSISLDFYLFDPINFYKAKAKKISKISQLKKELSV